MTENMWMPNRDELVEKCDYETRLAVTAWVMEHIVAHATEGGSYRCLIYQRLGFDTDAYAPLCADGLTISNEFEIGQLNKIRKAMRQYQVALPPEVKAVLQMCDVPGCYEAHSCGWPSEAGYRTTCYDHMDKRP